MPPDVLAETAHGIRNHPAFARAAIHYLDNLLQWREGPRLLNKLVGSYVRSQIIGNLLYMYFATDPENPDTGPTFAKLMALSETRDHCSPRVLKTVLALSQLAGFIATSRGRNDSRLKIYCPTEKLIEHVRAWYVQTFGCFDIMAPGGRYAERMREEPGMIGHLIMSIAEPFFAYDIKIGEHFPSVYELLLQDCGFPVIGTLVQATLQGEPIPSAPEISKRFGSSASQVRKVQRLATSLGLISISETDRAYNCKPLTLLLQDFIARELALYAQYALDLGVYFKSEHALPLESR